MNEQAIQDLIFELINMAVNLAADTAEDLTEDGELDNLTTASEIKQIETFEDNMILPNQKGLVIQTKDGSEFQISIVQSRMDTREFIQPIVGSPARRVRNGQPCGHAGCLSHVSHPCEGCGRQRGVGDIWVNTSKQKLKGKNEIRDQGNA